jgi:hypothetical protein
MQARKVYIDWVCGLLGQGDNFSRFIKDIVTLTCPGLCPTPGMGSQNVAKQPPSISERRAERNAVRLCNKILFR